MDQTLSQRQLETLQVLVGPGATEGDHARRVQAAIDLAIDDAALPPGVQRALNRYFVIETMQALRAVQKAFVHSGMEGLPAQSLIQLIVELLDGGWLNCSEAAHALSRLFPSASDQLPTPERRLLEIASMVAHDEDEGWMGPSDDPLLLESLRQYKAAASTQVSESPEGARSAAQMWPESFKVRIVPHYNTHFLPDFLELVKDLPNKEGLKWTLLDLDGAQRPDVEELAPGLFIGDLIHAIDASPDGLQVPWNDLESYARRWAFIAFLTVKAKAPGRHYFFKNFDSTYWDVQSNDQIYVARLRTTFRISGP